MVDCKAFLLVSVGDCPSGTQWVSLLGVCEVCPLDSFRRAGENLTCEFCPPGLGTVASGAGSEELCIDEVLSTAARNRPTPGNIYNYKPFIIYTQ